MPRSDLKDKKKKTNAKRRLQFGDDHADDSISFVPVVKNNETESSTNGLPLRDIVGESPSVVPATPEKKRRRLHNRKQDISAYFSPSRTTAIETRKRSVLVTPEKKSEPKTKEESQIRQHIPTYIHKNLNYRRRGQALLDETLKRVFELVEEHYVIPSNFESDRSYGPLSGTCFEERVVNAYDKELLLPSSDNEGGVLICSYCAELGHRQTDCPDLI